MNRCNRRTPTHSSIQLFWCVALLTPASGAGDFKRSTCLLILSALLKQPGPGSGEREREGQSGGPTPLVLRSVLDTACGTGLEDASCPPFKLRIQPLQLAGTSPGPSCTLHSHIDFFFLEGHEKCGLCGESNWGMEGRRRCWWRNRGSFLKHWLLLDCTSRRDNPVGTAQRPWCPAENC